MVTAKTSMRGAELCSSRFTHRSADHPTPLPAPWDSLIRSCGIMGPRHSNAARLQRCAGQRVVEKPSAYSAPAMAVPCRSAASLLRLRFRLRLRLRFRFQCDRLKRHSVKKVFPSHRSHFLAPKVRPIVAQGPPSFSEAALGASTSCPGSKPSTLFTHRACQQRLRRRIAAACVCPCPQNPRVMSLIERHSAQAPLSTPSLTKKKHPALFCRRERFAEHAAISAIDLSP